MKLRWIWAGALALSAAGCGEGDPETTTPNLPEDGRYAFESRFVEGESSVSHSGQTMRHLLILEISDYIDSLTEKIDSGELQPAEGDVQDALESFFEFDSATLGSRELSFDSDPAPLQKTFDDVSSGKNLVEKFAGNDERTDHADWTTQLRGWNGQESAEGLLRDWFAQLDAAAVARLNGDFPFGGDVPVYVTAEGLDLKQLIVKWLLMGVTYSQGTDDYLDDDEEGKGLLASNLQDEDAPYSSLEHAWDEGFGYFGAAADYADYTDEQIKEVGFNDTDGDGAIDLTSEACFGASINAAKRDLGAVAETNYTEDAFSAFVAGRALIASVDGELSDAQLDELRGYRNTAVEAWENAIAATAVHYINDLLQDTAAYGTEEENVADAAKHFGELKGFSLGLQFNPRSRLSAVDFDAFQEAIGDAPVLPDGEVEDYRAALLSARDILGAAYAFDEANLGDDQGEGGW